jgi:hypothetical protein
VRKSSRATYVALLLWLGRYHRDPERACLYLYEKRADGYVQKYKNPLQFRSSGY